MVCEEDCMDEGRLFVTGDRAYSTDDLLKMNEYGSWRDKGQVELTAMLIYIVDNEFRLLFQENGTLSSNNPMPKEVNLPDDVKYTFSQDEDKDCFYKFVMNCKDILKVNLHSEKGWNDYECPTKYWCYITLKNNKIVKITGCLNDLWEWDVPINFSYDHQVEIETIEAKA